MLTVIVKVGGWLLGFFGRVLCFFFIGLRFCSMAGDLLWFDAWMFLFVL